MNKAKRLKLCNPLEGVGTEEGGFRFWVLELLDRGGGDGGRSPPSIYIYIYIIFLVSRRKWRDAEKVRQHHEL